MCVFVRPERILSETRSQTLHRPNQICLNSSFNRKYCIENFSCTETKVCGSVLFVIFFFFCSFVLFQSVRTVSIGQTNKLFAMCNLFVCLFAFSKRNVFVLLFYFYFLVCFSKPLKCHKAICTE